MIRKYYKFELVNHMDDHVCVCFVTQLCPTLGDSMDCSPQAPLSMGIFQARILEWIAMLPPGALPNLGIEPTYLMPPAPTSRFFTTSVTWQAQMVR